MRAIPRLRRMADDFAAQLGSLLDDGHTSKLSTYRVLVSTSDIRGAGTDANVFVELKGAGGASSGPQALKGRGNLFESGKSDAFELLLPPLGQLASCDVWHDNSGAAQGARPAAALCHAGQGPQRAFRLSPRPRP